MISVQVGRWLVVNITVEQKVFVLFIYHIVGGKAIVRTVARFYYLVLYSQLDAYLGGFVYHICAFL